MTEVLVGVVTGLVTGFAYALAGYGAAYRQNPKTAFNDRNFMTSVVTGAIAGAVLGSQGISFGENVIQNFTALSSQFGLVYTLKKLARLIIKF